MPDKWGVFQFSMVETGLCRRLYMKGFEEICSFTKDFGLYFIDGYRLRDLCSENL